MSLEIKITKTTQILGSKISEENMLQLTLRECVECWSLQLHIIKVLALSEIEIS